MRLITRDRNSFSFGKLSDMGALIGLPLNHREPMPEHFTTRNFQYIVNNIADMFGYAPGTIQVRVEENDVEAHWLDRNKNDLVDEGEVCFSFVMNAQMNIYQRESIYGKHFMYLNAKKYGYPVIFAIAAHEVAHLVAHRATDVLESRLIKGIPALTVTSTMHLYWDELCADYLSGVVMGKANPPFDPAPQAEFLRQTKASSTHPDGQLRAQAFLIGYQWGKNNPRAQTSAIISRMDGQRQLLHSFHRGFYNQVYMRMGDVMRRYIPLPAELMEPCNLPLCPF